MSRWDSEIYGDSDEQIDNQIIDEKEKKRKRKIIWSIAECFEVVIDFVVAFLEY